MDIAPARMKLLNDRPPAPRADYVLYWMQNAQRAHFNPALEIAIAEANRLRLPLLACFGLTAGYPQANARHYAFMLEGLADVAGGLASRGVGFAVREGEPDAVALHFAKQAAVMVCDRGYLRPQQTWRARVAQRCGRRMIQVEGETVVPVEAASPKHEFAARTLRPKVQALMEDYLVPLAARKVLRKFTGEPPVGGADLGDVAKTLRALNVDQSVTPVRRFRGGQTEARRRLRAYLAGPFARYGAERGKPEANAASHLSPYLHFGQISPVEIALAVRAARKGGQEDKAAYLEELIVRRELAINHCHYEKRYDSYNSVPDWARATLTKHARDKRPFLYARATLEAGETHDRYWNAAMREMRETGYMHNRMRMYWGKKIIEWSPSPEAAFETALAINNKYFLDGRDANSYANVAWLFGLHDRPWAERPVFGTVRYMNENSLRKFDAKAYAQSVELLARAEAE